MIKAFSKYNLSDWLLLGIMMALVLFGTLFSKLHLFGPLYLHDFVLVIATMLSLFQRKFKLIFLPVVFIVFISFLYLIHSLLSVTVPIDITMRQYSIFGYLFLYYVIFNKSISNESEETNVNSLMIIGLISVVSQLLYIILMMAINRGFSVFENYNYLSPGVIFGLIISAAYILVAIKTITLKYTLILIITLLSFTTGHSSTFLAVFVVFCFYHLFLVTPKSRVIILIGVIIVIFAMSLTLPQFQDSNASWRLMLWGHVLEDAFVKNWGIIGNGFGVPYVSEDFAFKLYKEIGSTGFFDPLKPLETYLSAMHNSFLTIVFAIGFLPALLIVAPFPKMISYLLLDRKSRTNSTDFLVLSLLGSTVWVCFNVILELPHSAGIYWFVYFACWLSLINRSKKIPPSPPIITQVP
jgi:hypothetical protein